MSVRFALAADATAVATHHPNPEIAALAARIVRAQTSEDLPSFEEVTTLAPARRVGLIGSPSHLG